MAEVQLIVVTASTLVDRMVIQTDTARQLRVSITEFHYQYLIRSIT